VDLDFYAGPGPLTELTAEQTELVGRLQLEPLDLCRVAQGLLVAPPDAAGAGLDGLRLAERNLRPAAALLDRALHLDPLLRVDSSRPADRRVVGTCRHFAVMATALLRAVGVPARARCGFAAYFVPPRKVDHWIVELWSETEHRWIRVDPEWLDRTTPAASRTEDLRPGEFLSGGEAWQLVRSGQDDPALYGVLGTENWGAGEIRGNAVRDLASLAAKLEMLPWDEWGPMAASYEGTAGDDFDRLVDDLAAATAGPGPHDLRLLYGELSVPPELVA
jgi:hypothetical protein